jgi:hypothetical protein
MAKAWCPYFIITWPLEVAEQPPGQTEMALGGTFGQPQGLNHPQTDHGSGSSHPFFFSIFLTIIFFN